MKHICVLINCILLFFFNSDAQNSIINKNEPGSFPIVSVNASAIYTDANDDWLIQKSAALFQEDVEKVTGQKPEIIHSLPSYSKNIIVIGSIEQSSFIKELIQTKKLKADSLKGKWETYQIQVIKNPLKGIDNTLVIAGSDKRGTAYGVFEISREMGVSLWYYWAEVPVKIYVSKNIFVYDAQIVKYRGIFINDEAPAFSSKQFINLKTIKHDKKTSIDFFYFSNIICS
ncbi:MAG TPA: hypothetical protein VIJ92_08985 [Ginsengibacter sp.]